MVVYLVLYAPRECERWGVSTERRGVEAAPSTSRRTERVHGRVHASHHPMAENNFRNQQRGDALSTALWQYSNGVEYGQMFDRESNVCPIHPSRVSAPPSLL